MISAGYKSAYQQGYSDAMRDFRKEPKTGHWIEHDTGHSVYYACSLCGCIAPCMETADSYSLWKLSNFCPDCGAKMESEE